MMSGFQNYNYFDQPHPGAFVVSQTRATVAAQQPAGPPLNPWGLPPGNVPQYFRYNGPVPPTFTYAHFQGMASQFPSPQ